MARSTVLIGLLVLGSRALAQQAVPADIATRDQALRDQIQASDQRSQLQESNRAMRDQQIQRERFLYERWPAESADLLKNLVLLPPLPPTLAATETDPTALPYPAALADFAGEPFFMAYGSLLYRRLLSPPLIDRIEKYRNTRDRLVAGLRAHLARAEATPHSAGLTETGAAQVRELLSLETEADSIRRDLTAFDDGSALARQRDAAPTTGQPALRGYFTALLAAHFHEGLSLDQRFLLHELAWESLLDPIPSGQSGPAFFLPAGARVRWPDLPAPAAEALGQFERLHSKLKSDLRQVVLLEAEKLAGAKRTKKYAALAATQSAAFAELHQLAEDFRTSLTGQPMLVPPAPSPYPPELVRQVGLAVTHKTAFKIAAKRCVQEFDREFSPQRFKITFANDEPVIQSLPPAEGSKPTVLPSPAQTEKVATRVAQLRADYATLSAEMAAARAATERYRETLTGDEVPAVSQLLASLAQVHAREENWRRFADYRTAVLTPGLTPAQRRLLFNAALRDLEKHRLATTE